jgi:hypothetical protein
MRVAIATLPSTPSWCGAQLKKAQGQLKFTFCCIEYMSLGVLVYWLG